MDGYCHFDGEEYKARVCFCCDRLFMGEEMKNVAFRFIQNRQSLFDRSHYVSQSVYDLFDTYRDKDEARDERCNFENIYKKALSHYKYTGEGYESWMDTYVMSPRSCYVPPKSRSRKKDRQQRHFLCCKECYLSLHNSRYPVKGIANGWI